MIRLIAAVLIAVATLVFAALAPAASITVPKGSTCQHDADATTITITCAATVIVTQPNPNPPPPPPPPNPTPPAAGCPGANIVSAFTFNGQKHAVRLATGVTWAISFRTGAESDIEVSTTETTQTPVAADHEVAVSRCPGDFTPAPPCRYQAFNVGQTMFTTTRALLPWLAGSRCRLEPNTTYYMNVRQVVRGTVNTPSCTLAEGCDVRVQIQNFFP